MVSPYFITAILGAIVMYCIYYLVTINSNYWTKRGVKCIPPVPIFGVMLDVLLLRKGLSQLFKDIYFEFEGGRYGGFFQFMSPSLMLRDPELINQVLIKDFNHFEDRSPPMKEKSDLFSLGLANLTGDEWRAARHKLTPTFTSGKLKMMFDPIIECCDGVVTHINKNLNEDFNAKDLSLKYILNVIASVAFGLKLNTLEEDKNSDFYKVSSKFFKPSTIFMLKMTIFSFAPKLREYLNIQLTEDDVEKFFRKLTKDVIKYRESTGTRRNDFLQLMLDQREREKEMIRNGNVPTNLVNNEEVDPDDAELLEQLKNISNGNEAWKTNKEVFTEDFIASQAFLFISGGSETTGTVLNFVLYELAANPDCQRRAQQEITDVLSNSELNYQAIKKMTYLEQVINETLRRNPIGAGLMRLCTKDYKIPGTDVIIDKGTFVAVPIAALHKDPQYFPDPEKFNPDRFENMETIPKGVFFNFGAGPRICIAMRLAMLEMRMYLAKLLLNYNILLSKRTKLPLKPLKNSVMLTMEGVSGLDLKKGILDHLFFVHIYA